MMLIVQKIARSQPRILLKIQRVTVVVAFPCIAGRLIVCGNGRDVVLALQKLNTESFTNVPCLDFN